MNRRSVAGLALALVLAACSDTDRATPTGPDADFAAARSAAPVYLVLLRPDVTDVPGAARGVAGAHGLELRQTWGAIRGFSAHLPEARLEAVRSDPRVQMVEPDGPVSLIAPVERGDRPGAKAPPFCRIDPTDPRCGGDGGGGGGGQVTPWGIARVGGPVGGATGTAWVIDSGVDLDHPDLNVDPACSANFAQGGKNSPDDGNGHGTHVAGTIGALDNGIDVVGVAPGVRICAVRVLGNSGSGSWEGVAAGVNHVAAYGKAGDVANMSLGGTASGSIPNLVEAAILTAASKVKFALAAGNEGEDANAHTPARLNGTNVYTVSAIDASDRMPSWSNWGNPPVDYAEPGVGVLSTRRGGGTTSMSGTSMATPHLAGLLLVGNIRSGGTAKNDPDGSADVIGVH